MKKSIKWIIPLLILITISSIIYKNYENLVSNVQNIIDNVASIAKEKKNGLEDIISNGKLISESDLNNLEDSGIDGSNYTANANYYPYYEMLSTTEQTIYKQIYANINNLQTTFIPTTTINKDQLPNIIESIYNDHPELFWLNTSYSYKYTSDGTVAQIILEFNSTINDIDNAKAKFDNAANTIINYANTLSSDYEKEKYVHDAILKIASYNESAQLNQSAYSALVNGSTVCAGYSKAFQYIMIELGIPTYYVTGYASGNHAWNIVNLSDGYYNVDLTWNDGNTISYTYFNIPDATFSMTHQRTSLSLNLPSCTATQYSNLETTNQTTTATNTDANNNTENNDSNNYNENNNETNNNSNTYSTEEIMPNDLIDNKKEENPTTERKKPIRNNEIDKQ